MPSVWKKQEIATSFEVTQRLDREGRLKGVTGFSHQDTVWSN